VSIANRGWVVGACNSRTNSTYQLGEYADRPLHDDPYSPGQRGHKDAAVMLAKLNAMLSSFEKGSLAPSRSGEVSLCE
jgi:hypothetical protein